MKFRYDTFGLCYLVNWHDVTTCELFQKKMQAAWQLHQVSMNLGCKISKSFAKPKYRKPTYWTSSDQAPWTMHILVRKCMLHQQKKDNKLE